MFGLVVLQPPSIKHSSADSMSVGFMSLVPSGVVVDTSSELGRREYPVTRHWNWATEIPEEIGIAHL